MKKLISILAAVAICSTASAQLPKGLSVGAGVTITPLAYHPDEAGEDLPSSLSGLNVFAEYEYQLSDISGVSLGLRYNLAGLMYHSTTTIMSYSVETKYKWNYLQIPLKYVAHLGNFYVNAGPTFDFWTKCSRQDKVDGRTSETDLFSQLESDKVNKVNILLGAEIGYTFEDHLRIFAGYDYATLPLIKYTKLGEEWTLKKNEIRFGLAYCF